MKRYILLIILLMIFAGCCIFNDEVTNLYYNAVRYFTAKEIVLKKNEYYREYDFKYVQNTVDFEPKNKQDVLNIFYTVINSGQESFSFYCPDEYESCTNDIKNLANDQSTLSHINNFVHPYNGFKHIETSYNSLGEITINVFKNYDQSWIPLIDKKVNEIMSSNIADSYTDRDKIKIAHDFIINNSIYDTSRSDQDVVTYKSDIAYGPLIEGYGICGGYSDAMALFLERFGIKNFKASSDTHIWNVVYLDGSWYHLDLTWDDPITPDGTQILDDSYFLINSDSLRLYGSKEHIFDEAVYMEVK